MADAVRSIPVFADPLYARTRSSGRSSWFHWSLPLVPAYSRAREPAAVPQRSVISISKHWLGCGVGEEAVRECRCEAGTAEASGAASGVLLGSGQRMADEGACAQSVYCHYDLSELYVWAKRTAVVRCALGWKLRAGPGRRRWCGSFFLLSASTISVELVPPASQRHQHAHFSHLSHCAPCSRPGRCCPDCPALCASVDARHPAIRRCPAVSQGFPAAQVRLWQRTEQGGHPVSHPRGAQVVREGRSCKGGLP